MPGNDDGGPTAGVYRGTRFELVLANDLTDRANGEPPKFALGIVDQIGGRGFGHYASVGIIAEGEQHD